MYLNDNFQNRARGVHSSNPHLFIAVYQTPRPFIPIIISGWPLLAEKRNKIKPTKHQVHPPPPPPLPHS